MLIHVHFSKNTVTTHIDHTAVIYTCMCGSYTVYSFVYHDVVKVNCIYNHMQSDVVYIDLLELL